MLEVEDIANEQLNVSKIVVGHRVDEHVEHYTLCRAEVDPTVVETLDVCHVVNDFTMMMNNYHHFKASRVTMNNNVLFMYTH